jgi:Peptidase family M23
MNKHIVLFVLVAVILFAPSLVGAQVYQYNGRHGAPVITISGPPSIIFPVQGGATFSDDFGAPRSGHVHEGNDLIAPKMTPILAARGGRIVFEPMTEPSYGYMITIAGDDGYTYNYLHINNDTPGTDDGLGGPQYAYAPGITEGVTVTQGQHIAWVGDSGDAENTVSHLHFEIRLPDGTAIDPYPYLNAALKIYTFNVAAAETASPTINSDKGLIVSPSTALYCVPGSLIRTPLSSSVYYCGSDGKRYDFPNALTYATWYKDFSGVQTITPEDMANVSLGGNVTYRPGVKLVKIQTDNKVYAVDRNGTLRWVSSPAIAAKYYGASWVKKVEDIPDVFFTNYKIGDPVTN